MTSARTFLGLFVGLTLAGLVAVAGLDLLVDPYGLYGVWARAGVNAQKPEEAFHDRMVRAHAVRRVRPDAVLLGTSRTQVGLEPGAPALAAHAVRPLNLGLSGGTPQEALRLLQHASALGEVRLAVVGLDVVGFNAYALPNPEHSEARLAVDADGRAQPLSFAADWAATLLSFEAVRATKRTLTRQAEGSYFYPNGRRRERTLQERIVAQGGMRATMQWSEDFYLGEYQCFALRRREDGRAPGLEALEALLRLGRARGIRTVLFFSPTHARAQLALEAAGHGPAFLAWKRAVVALAHAHGAELWDFGGADPRYTAEPVPPPGDAASRMAWYWESSHYTAALGDVVLARMLGGATSEHAGFGVRLTPETAERELARVNAEVAAWAAAHPDQLAEIRALATAKRAGWPGCENGAPWPPPPLPPEPAQAQAPEVARGE